MVIEHYYKLYKTQRDCIRFLEEMIWNGIPQCPYCNSKRQTPQPKEQRYHCGVCRVSYSVTAKTMFHKTKVDLQKWFVAIPLIVEERISARQLAKVIEVTKDTACLMVRRIEIAKKDEPELINKFLNKYK